jgi:heme o synthase
MCHFSMARLISTATLLRENYLPLVKSRQTILLTLTGAAGYLCQPSVPIGWWTILGLVGSLLLTISGCTVLNMLLDRDLDCQMERTRHRPLADGRVNSFTAAWMGGALLSVGLLWAALLSIPYFAVILVGAIVNVLVYTIWLKRRSAWSILLGGVAGGMPVLAGHVLAIGYIDLLGLLLALVIVFWIPSHNLTLSMLYSSDYLKAGVPTFLNTYGRAVTNGIIAISVFLVSLIFMFVFTQLGLLEGILVLFIILCFGLIVLAALACLRPSQKLLAVLYKYSSLYLLLSTLLLVYSGLR